VPDYNRREILNGTLAAAATATLGSLAGCSGDNSSDSGGSDQLSVSAFTVGDRTDTWNRSLISAWETVQSDMEGIDISFQSEVSPSESSDLMRQFAESGSDLIWATGVEYNDTALNVSQEYPDVAFENVAGSDVGENMGQNYVRYYEACYLAGYAAALTLEENGVSDPLMGHLSIFPIPVFLRRVNAFANGAHAATGIETEANYIGAAYDPPKERQGTQALIDQGVDCIYKGSISTTPEETARDNDIWSVGRDSSSREEAGEKYVTATLPNWAKMYTQPIELAQNGNWEPEFRWNGFKYDWQSLDDFGPTVPDSAIDEVEQLKQEIIDGELDPFHDTIYEGYHNDVQEPGITDNDEFLLNEVSEHIGPVRGKADQ